MKRSEPQLTRQPQDYLSIKTVHYALPITGNVSQVAVELWPKVGAASRAVTSVVRRSLVETVYSSRRRSDFARRSQNIEEAISVRVRQYVPMPAIDARLASLIFVLTCQTTAGLAPMRVKRRVVVAIRQVELDDGEIWV